MHESNSHHFPIGRNLDKIKIPQSTELSDRFSDLTTTEKNKKYKLMESKIHKEKIYPKPVNILKRIFSHKSNSNKFKTKKELSPAKAIAQSTIDIFAQSPSIPNDMYINSTMSISTGNLVTVESSQVSQLNEKKFHNSDIHIKLNCVPIASVESLSTNNSSQRSYQFPGVPKIVREIPSSRNSPLLTQNDPIESDVHLNLPENDRSRKSSENDSAVDLKFTDDSSDQDRTNTSDTGSSRCPSTSFVFTDECHLGVPVDTSISNAINTPNKVKRTESSSSWRKLKAAFIWTPFIQQCARHKYPWIQIAGHQGNFKPGEQGTILKKYTGRESICLQMMNEDVLADFVPQFKCDIDYEGERYICMQDLLANFQQPSLIDIKMGTRTYLEEELIKAQHCPKPRQDMYEKMIEIDENEPTEHEHKIKAILKPRYMQWRETLSSTITLGFRIEGVKKVIGTQSRDYKRTKDRDEVKQILVDFIDNKLMVLNSFIRRLRDLKSALSESLFFWEHEFIGSSLLFVHDKNGNANTWMIDFGKTIPLPPNCKIDHRSLWIEGNHEDGYLFGLENLLNIFLEIHSEMLIKAN